MRTTILERIQEMESEVVPGLMLKTVQEPVSALAEDFSDIKDNLAEVLPKPFISLCWKTFY